MSEASGSSPQRKKTVRKKRSADGSVSGSGSTCGKSSASASPSASVASKPQEKKKSSNQILKEVWKSRKLGKYKLLEVLGAGAMGGVFLAEDDLLKRKIALKILPQKVEGEQETFGVKQFKREARSGALIDHRHVVRVYDSDAAEGYFYIAMELVQGGDLAKLVKEEGPMEYHHACELAAQAAEALAGTHAAGIVHRDVKPANFMLTTDLQIKLADFGLARIDDPDDKFTIGEMVGTPKYVSPEVCRGEPATPRSDIYSLGATIWFMLTGQAPFDESDPRRCMAMHVKAKLPNLREQRDDLPEALVQAIEKSLAKEPDDRYQSAEEFAEILHNFAEEDEMASLAAAAASALSTGPLPTAGRVTRPDRKRRDAAKSEESKSAGLPPAALYGGIAAGVLVIIGVIVGLIMAFSGPTPKPDDGKPDVAGGGDAPGAKPPVIQPELNSPGSLTPPVIPDLTPPKPPAPAVAEGQLDAEEQFDQIKKAGLANKPTIYTVVGDVRMITPGVGSMSDQLVLSMGQLSKTTVVILPPALRQQFESTYGPLAKELENARIQVKAPLNFNFSMGRAEMEIQSMDQLKVVDAAPAPPITPGDAIGAAAGADNPPKTPDAPEADAKAKAACGKLIADAKDILPDERFEPGYVMAFYKGDQPTASKLTDFKVIADQPIQYDWDMAGPDAKGIGADKFMVRFDGYIVIPKTGSYTFYVNADNAARLTIADQLVMDHGSDSKAMREQTVTVELKKGFYPFRLDYYENIKHAYLKWSWSLKDEFAKTPVPAQAFWIWGDMNPDWYKWPVDWKNTTPEEKVVSTDSDRIAQLTQLTDAGKDQWNKGKVYQVVGKVVNVEKFIQDNDGTYRWMTVELEGCEGSEDLKIVVSPTLVPQLNQKYGGELGKGMIGKYLRFKGRLYNFSNNKGKRMRVMELAQITEGSKDDVKQATDEPKVVKTPNPADGDKVSATDTAMVKQLGLDSNGKTYQLTGDVEQVSKLGGMIVIKFRNAGDLLVVLDKSIQFNRIDKQFKGANGSGLVDKQITVVGKITQYNGKPRMYLDSLDPIHVGGPAASSTPADAKPAEPAKVEAAKPKPTDPAAKYAGMSLDKLPLEGRLAYIKRYIDAANYPQALRNLERKQNDRNLSDEEKAIVTAAIKKINDLGAKQVQEVQELVKKEKWGQVLPAAKKVTDEFRGTAYDRQVRSLLSDRSIADQIKAWEWLEKANALYDKEDYRDAKKAYEDIKSRYPKSDAATEADKKLRDVNKKLK